MTEEIALICMPVVDGVYVYPGSIQGVCADCGQKVWIAPSGQQVADKVVFCFDCGTKRIGETDADVGILPETKEEVKAWRRRN